MLLELVIDAATKINPEKIHIVYGHGGEEVLTAFPRLPFNISWVYQSSQLGTGHAVKQVMPYIPNEALVLILYGDAPLVRAAFLAEVVSKAGTHGLGLVTARLPDPTGYGRITRDADDRVTGIVEEKDATNDQRGITEVNTGIMVVPAGYLREWVESLTQDNIQEEFYLTDIVQLAVQKGIPVETVMPESMEEVLGINDRVQLASLERYYQREQARLLMESGVTLRDPARLDIRGDVAIGKDVTIDVNVILEGRVVIADGVNIGPNTYIRDSEIGSGTQIQANCVIEGAVVRKNCRIGPFARIRPDTQLAEGVRVGNFVEIKKTDVGEGSKVNHLTYIGDARIGCDVNVGAGTVTCNYDGMRKHRTEIQDDVFIGSGAMLVAPVTLGRGSTIGAGSTITKNTPPNRLSVERNRQLAIKGWKRTIR
uniref:Bifunctional protein GlmU n=1 Tax=Candidatus Kentrum sp. MB TaxID=2138164 RepID=A0A450XEJ2_9GAMM|nr:MAG: UDP-N-acetylglucosamine pyrophosphorylase /glucosamine-1-phosphate N-acetyltransferase [Candidatus Kentron sp. MB]VFK27710.1 MAG: UDP-N-acetylglucosamine pyrophosphorylase /glucosamine-1-phosphate N-acetyltransferase [Candidatus Kentron sp. MB]VFK74399.1 MAG: UDP-N-acetylglucosamine pyrophosphorylase /glucosamine-1-phosphate N-acetyltransferase [Candidatus Kentron sp. MB]